MKKIKFLVTFFLFTTMLQAQIANKLFGTFKAAVQVTTEFTDSQYAIAEVEKNSVNYKWLAGVYNFKKDGTFTFTKQDKTIETGRFSADDTRVKLVFDAENLPELNAINPKLTENGILVPFSMGMTKVNLLLRH